MEAAEHFVGNRPISMGQNSGPKGQIPSRYEEGFFDVIEGDEDLGYQLVRQDPPGLEHFASAPLRYARGLAHAVRQVAELHLIGHDDMPGSKRRLERVGENDRSVLVTDPRAGSSSPITSVLQPGLSEMDTGSAELLHDAVSKRHPDRRVVTITTPGVSHRGKVLSIREGLDRELDETADENLALLRRLAGDGELHLIGTSLGSYIATHMAAKNLAANGADMLDISGLRLLAPAVGARNVPDAERFRESDLDDEILIDEATRDFFKHMLWDPINSGLRHPERAAQCLAVIGAYALAPKKLPHRIAAMTGNLRGVQQGIEWEDLKDVARGTELHVLGGEKDPLVQATLDQWLSIQKIAPSTKLWVIEGLGHTMTIASDLVADSLAKMESPKLV